MPKRRRNPDGSLVTPLSEAQLASLERGRAALAARVAGTKESAPAVKGATAQRGGRRVETVKLGAKASTTKPPVPRKRAAKPRTKAPAAEAKESSGGTGLIDRAIEWFGRGE